MAGTTTLLGLVTPTQGDLSGTWGDTVNYGITDYVDIAIAGTLSFSGDGAITLANTTGSSSGNAIGSTTAQYMVIRVTGTLTTPKIITGPSYSKLYMVDNAATGSTVSFIRAGQATPVSIAVGEKAFVYYNGTDYVKVGSAGGIAYTAVKTSNYTAVNNDGVLTNTTGGSFTVTLPTSPSVGNAIIVVDSLSQWGTNNLIVDPTASIKIAGNTAGDTLTCDITGATVTLVYTGATYGWNVAAQVGGNGGTAVTLTGTQTLTNKTLTAPVLTSPNITTALTLTSASGTSGDVLTSAGSGNAPTWTTPASATAATQAQMEAASSNTVFATPLNLNWHPGVAKAWANVDGAGTVINASHNVASITDTGTGVLDVTLTTAFSSASYVILITAKNGGGSPRVMYVSAQLAGSFQASSANIAGAAVDPQLYLIACFGDQ